MNSTNLSIVPGVTTAPAGLWPTVSNVNSTNLSIVPGVTAAPAGLWPSVSNVNSVPAFVSMASVPSLVAPQLSAANIYAYSSAPYSTVDARPMSGITTCTYSIPEARTATYTTPGVGMTTYQHTTGVPSVTAGMTGTATYNTPGVGMTSYQHTAGVPSVTAGMAHGFPQQSIPDVGSDFTGNTFYELGADDDIALNVSPTIQEKIQKGEYVDLALLLSNQQDNLSLHRVEIIQGQLVLKPRQPHNFISSIDQWTSAFIVYIYVYCKAHPSRFLELLKYMHMVRLGAKRTQMGWKSYDEQFRMRKARYPASSWGKVDYKLWLLHMNTTITYGSANPALHNANNNAGLKCYTFNFEGRCFKQFCPYKHLCLRCGGSHPIIHCPLKQANGFVTSDTRLPNPSNSRPRFPRFSGGRQVSAGNQFRPRYAQATQRQRSPF